MKSLQRLMPILLLALALPAVGQAQQVVRTSGGTITIIDSGEMVVHAPSVPGATPAPESGPPNPRQEKLKQLEFDRRPSAILAAWSGLDKKAEEAAPEAPSEEESEVELEEFEVAGVGHVGTGAPAVAAPAAPAAPSPSAPAVAEPPAEAAADPEAAKAAAAEAAKKKAEEDAAKAAEEAKALEKELAAFQRQVTLGQWSEVKSYLAGLTEDERKAGYQRLLESLEKGPSQRPTNVLPQGQAFLEKNRFAPEDVVGLAAAAPAKLEKKDLEALGRILRQSLDAGHQMEAFLTEVSPRLEEEGFGLDRRALARMLVAAGEPMHLEGLLPAVDAAERDDDREGLNLLSRFYLARWEKEKKLDWLEQAWKVTQAVLAVGEVGDEDKKEALAHAVDIAPRLRAELGQAWLDESFTARPERGMEILSAIGTAASQGLQSRPLDADGRLKLLELSKTAAEALLSAAPERATEWRAALSLLAGNWLREALHTYQWDESTAFGPSMQRDFYGNFFFYNERAQRQGNMPAAIATDKILETRPGDAWLERIDATLRPRLQMACAQLLLKVSEEAQAFPYIEAVAALYPRQSKDLADEFLRVWARNHDPNQQNRRTSNYVFFYGFEERAAGIPLTRSKQERNLSELAEWVARLRKLDLELDDKLLAQAFTTAHSTAEVYRLETIERIFGALEALEPATLAELVQGMRANLVTVWRDPALQKEKKTNRRQQDIQAEVLRGYELAHATLERAIAEHPESWELALVQASIDHDENNYRHELAQDPEFSARRQAAFEGFRAAAERYAQGVEGLEREEESTRAFELWFYAALGACDLNAIDPKMALASAEIPRIREFLAALPGERAERHLGMFSSTLFTRMSSVSPGVKFRYVREGLAIAGEHELAREARKVFDYYSDLVTEIQLVASVDGSDRVGHGAPFGLRVDIRHTKEIERESGGFSKYLQNQNSQRFGWNYGRPLEDYRDKFEEAAREALSEPFEVLSVTFNEPEVRSRAEAEYGWRRTPYAYLLLRPRGPQVDRVPPLHLDLDFLDTSGYAVLPIETAPVPIDASAPAGDARPYEKLALTQTLDERQAKDGKLILEVKASAVGLVPGLDEILDFAPPGFGLPEREDHGLAVVKFDEEVDAIDSERTWTLVLRAGEAREQVPKTFAFGMPRIETASSERFRFADADLVSAPETVELEQRYGEPSRAWLLWIPAVLALAVLVWLARRWLSRPRLRAAERFQVPEPLTPFSVLGLLRTIERDGLDPGARSELGAEIERLERHFFVDAGEEPPDLRAIAQSWIERAG